MRECLPALESEDLFRSYERERAWTRNGAKIGKTHDGGQP